MTAVLDADQQDLARLIDSIEHSVSAAAGGPDAVQIGSQRLADTLWR
jgi:hypothetical protein